MKGVEAAEAVGDLASQQWGLVTTAQTKRIRSRRSPIDVHGRDSVNSSRRQMGSSLTVKLLKNVVLSRCRAI